MELHRTCTFLGNGTTEMTEVIVCTIGELKSRRCRDCNKIISFGHKYCVACYHKRRTEKLNR